MRYFRCCFLKRVITSLYTRYLIRTKSKKYIYNCPISGMSQLPWVHSYIALTTSRLFPFDQTRVAMNVVVAEMLTVATLLIIATLSSFCKGELWKFNGLNALRDFSVVCVQSRRRVSLALL